MYKWNNPTLIVVAHTEGRDHLLDITLPNLKALSQRADVQVIDVPPGLAPASAWVVAEPANHHDFIIYTVDEVLVPLDAVERMRAHHDPERRSTPLLYFINRPLMQFVTPDDPHAIQKHPDFFNVYNRWGLYNREMSNWKHHVLFTGHTRDGWERLGFPPPLVNYGEGDDAWLWKREHELGRYVNQIDLTIYHLFHGSNRIAGGTSTVWQEQNYKGESPRVRRAKESVSPT